MSIFKRLLFISRPALWINSLGPALLGLWFTGNLWTPQAFPIFLWLSLPFNLLIYGVNDIFDYEIDQISARKDSYQGARLDKSEFLLVWLGVLAFNLPFLLFFIFKGSLVSSLLIFSYCAYF